MNRAAVFTALIVIVLLVGGVVIANRPHSAPPSATATPPSTAATALTKDTITYTGNDFTPGVLTITSGSTVTIKNVSTDDLQLDSNPHPIHTDDTDLNVGAVPPGQSRSFTVIKKGTFHYHNHLNPVQTGEIVIN
ncbi:cupredoxin domain-containing protein [Patescibacteria group bacterium]|nr:cupredoxin domain-containing protein [Patescibacteria group bacterium]